MNVSSGAWDAAATVRALEGAIDVEWAADRGWAMPWRLPVADLELHHRDLVLPAMCPSGVRIRLRTASTRILLDAESVQLQGGPVFEAWCDLSVDGEVVRSTALGVAGVVFGGLPPGDKEIEIALPIVPAVRLRGLRTLDGEALHPLPDPRPRWTVYGSSISHGYEATPTQTWPATAARLLGRNLTNLGYGGACLLDPLVGRMLAKHPADFITLELGINVYNSAALRERTFLPAVHGLLAEIRSRQPDLPVTVLGPVFGGARETELADGMSEAFGDLTLGALREQLHDAVELRRKRGDTALTWIDGRELCSATDAAHGVLPDGLHPHAAHQQEMGRLYAELCGRC
ncbi:GDSL-type esterase/lipase family protein [Streptacidiphilus jiangxiensis]|uniref:Lysophospholipase L1 n=1 Tax=Streptacidiphilus jiangxiensis TaxID=235985 RepID=A0A1H7F679_STRJI|nr:GDSL-type esterase/lipase family protein [Streptacidiphilus jiangxiensis]SEK21633.1 Lysophospholipase L1 [Streptacidiphilus jiangxiensis]